MVTVSNSLLRRLINRAPAKWNLEDIGPGKARSCRRHADRIAVRDRDYRDSPVAAIARIRSRIPQSEGSRGLSRQVWGRWFGPHQNLLVQSLGFFTVTLWM
jgi:hypothetical protein